MLVESSVYSNVAYAFDEYSLQYSSDAYGTFEDFINTTEEFST
jgi:hypothetical protein